MAKTKTWKATEKKVAKLVGGKRVGNRGTNSEDVCTDVVEGVEQLYPGVEKFSIECKHSSSLPAWLREGYAQAKRNAKGKEPLLVVHPKHSRIYYAILPIEILMEMIK